LLNQWNAYPDFNWNKGTKVKNLKNVNRGSLVLLTTVLPESKEKDRIIFGVYFLQAEYEFDYNTKGYLGADEKFRLELSLDEAKKVKFWDYYFNVKNPEKIANTSGLYRYLDDVQAVQVLKYISEMKKGTDGESISNEMLQRYCNVKNIDVNTITEPKGALRVQK